MTTLRRLEMLFWNKLSGGEKINILPNRTQNVRFSARSPLMKVSPKSQKEEGKLRCDVFSRIP